MLRAMNFSLHLCLTQKEIKKVSKLFIFNPFNFQNIYILSVQKKKKNSNQYNYFACYLILALANLNNTSIN